MARRVGPFFGRAAHTPPGAAILALRTLAPLVPAFIDRRPAGRHVIRFAPMPIDRRGTGTVDLTARFTATIEAAIREAPADWVWWHERWRRRPDGAQAGVV